MSKWVSFENSQIGEEDAKAEDLDADGKFHITNLNNSHWNVLTWIVYSFFRRWRGRRSRRSRR